MRQVPSPWSLMVLWCCFGLSASSTSRADKCLTDLPEVSPKIYPNYLNQRINITLLTTSRPLQMINTYIFKIYLEEVMGFNRIAVSVAEDYFELDPVVAALREEQDTPKAHINLEVWLPVDIDETSLEDTKLIREYGVVAPPGRFGWFIPWELRGALEEKYLKSDYHTVQWTFLKNKDLVANFDVDEAGNHVIWRKLGENSKRRTAHCGRDPICLKGTFTPDRCASAPCAVLLASHYNETKFAIEHIEDLQLLVRIFFLGDKLKETAAELTKIAKASGRGFIILHYTPGDVILRERNFINVAFTRCEMLNTTKSIGCKYEVNRIYKLAWNKIEKLGSEEMGQLMRNYKFGEGDYDHLLTLYEAMGEEGLEGVACRWLREKKETWSLWTGQTTTKVIYIGGIFPITASSYNGPGIVTGAVLAKEQINKNPTILPNHQLELLVHDGKCRPDAVLKKFIDYAVDSDKKMIGVLGPACSDTVEPLAGVSKYYHILIISYSAEGASFSDRKKYPYFFRTIGENKQYKHVYLKLFKKMGWTRVAALTEDGQKYTEYISHMQEMLEENGITFISNTKFPRESNSFHMTRYLEDLKKKTAKIIILDVIDEIARTTMCEAFRLRMTPADGYVWFLPNWLNVTWYDTDFFNVHQRESVNCSTADMIKAVNGYFSLAHQYFAPRDTVVIGNMTVDEWQARYDEKMKNRPVKQCNYAGYAYDAVWTYVLALDALVKSDPEAISDLHSENTTNKLVELIKATDFMGVSGQIKFRGGPSRFSTINIVQFYDNRTHEVGRFKPNMSEDKPEILGGRLTLEPALRWFTRDGKIPSDGAVPPESCALEGLAKAFNVSCQMALVILNLLAGLVVLLGLSVGLFVIKRRYDKKVRYTQKYMRHLGIDLKSADISDLDKWEIARSSVVINRKLGEGAFGTVYGGEVDLPGRGWVPVAVKTLKKGSTAEERLDFLSEAEVMKRFDHKNIVRLLAVCTKEEPVYTIMEFMLYGDLKTFLLARRNLVDNKAVEESEEISSKRLTGMALDVARALSHLAQLRYVHRDVACRNCLVNDKKVVKLGDFGMTRPMFENEYYRFSRKGMLPVRWMAPESLASGIFTPASDVWSFGILLYEIITFGSFPYRELSNYEVLDFVKKANTIEIPEGVKTQLKILLKSCWQQDPKKRPRSSEIAEFLASNPRLIVPCLETPMASVQRDDHTAEADITLPESKIIQTVSNGNVANCSTNEDLKLENGENSYCIKQPLLHEENSAQSLFDVA